MDVIQYYTGGITHRCREKREAYKTQSKEKRQERGSEAGHHLEERQTIIRSTSVRDAFMLSTMQFIKGW